MTDDPVLITDLKSQITQLRRERDDALKRAVNAEKIRRHIFELPPPKGPPKARKHKPEPHGPRSAILHISDIHYAETVPLKEMDGLNSYNIAIANNRIRRTFETACDLLTTYWSGEPVEELHLCLGGDLVSGAIHEELARTDSLMRLESAREVALQLAAGVQMILDRVGCKIFIYSVPGNHGRLSHKPEHKGVAVDSLDTLACWFLEEALRDAVVQGKASVHYSDSVDFLFEVYGRKYLLTHGDRIGSKGGTGFVGPIATILRGYQKIYTDYADRGVILYKILTGHFHTTAKLPLGYSNGSIIGWNDFARDLRSRKEPASQNLLIVHGRRGVISFQEIYPGRPEEGTIN